MTIKFNTNVWRDIKEYPRDGKYRLFYSKKSNEFRVYNWPINCVIGHWQRNRKRIIYGVDAYAYDGYGDVSFRPTHFMNLPKKPYNAKA